MRRGDITPQMRKRMSPEDEAWLDRFMDRAVPPPLFHVEQSEPKIPKLERDEHGVFQNWLLSHGFAYRHSRTDKATREMCGAPDFTVYQKRGYLNGDTFYPQASLLITNRCLAVEFKRRGEKLSQAQETWAEKYGGIVHVLATAAEAIELVKREFGE